MSIDIFAIRQRYRDLDTDALVALWCREERLASVENELRKELLERGISEDEVLRLAGLRQEIASRTAEHNAQQEFGIFGPLLAIFVGFGSASIANAFFGWRGAVIALIVVALFFSYHLFRFTKYKSSQSPNGFSLTAVKGVVLLGTIAVGIICGVIALFL